ncbi:MAG: sugar phosphate isomerase/epimerase [Planctomycetota bacterium]|nr:sugar phosphate isomerase/epimerase [Planctomycetota bacterium]
MNDSTNEPARPLGTMVAYGFERGLIAVDLEVARQIGATCVEVLPDWPNLPDPIALRTLIADGGFTVHSAHACWGGRSILAPRVDLGSIEPPTWEASLEDLKRCLDWLRDAGGTHLIIHPGGLSDPEQTAGRRDALTRGLTSLAKHIGRSGLVVCVENMPPGVHPGSRMDELVEIVTDVADPAVGLAIDTGHANMVATAGSETRIAGRWLRSTHVHDNNGRQDVHEPPGHGTIDWPAWIEALDAISYSGPIMLECIRYLRQRPATIDGAFLERLAELRGHRRNTP